MMKNMKVKQKLMASFLVIAIITAVSGGVGIAGLLQLNENEAVIFELGVKLNYVNTLIETIHKQRIAYRDVVLYVDNAQKRENAIVQSGELDAEYQELHTYLLEHMTTAKAQQFLKNIHDVYENSYAPLRNTLLEAGATSGDEYFENLMDQVAVELDIMMVNANGLIDYAIDYTEGVSDKDEQTAYRLIAIVTALAVVAVGGAICLGLYLSKHITAPLFKMKALIDRIGNTGCLDFSEDEMHDLEDEAQGKDEICQSIASSVKMIRHLTNASGAMKQVTEGDLTAKLQSLSEKDTIGVVVNQMLDQLNAMFGEISRSSAQVSAGAEQVSQGAQELASGSSQQAASIQEFTATLVELRNKTDNNAENANNAREANGRAAERLDGSIRSMSELLKAMKAIDESSGNITKVIKVIDDIAFQTNILALNAAVEAARAGQHGKGFAVVADEVRNLAAKSAEAAKETAELIEGSSARVKEGNQIVAKTNADLEAASENAREITRMIEQVAIESGEQARAIAEINQGIEQIASVVQSNSATSEQSAAASEQMSAQAMTLKEIVSRFKTREDADGKDGFSTRSGESRFALM